MATPAEPSGLAYDLASWDDDARRSLSFLLHESGVDPRWLGTTLVVPTADRAVVDGRIAWLTNPGAPPAAASLGAATSALPSRPPVAAPPPTLPPPGWYDDPWRQHPLRWWDGRAWTGHTGPPERERRWIPPRRADDDTPGMRGGGLALAGLFGGIALGLGLGYLLLALGVSRRSPTVLVVSQFGLWAGLVSAPILAVRRHGDGSLRQLGLARLRWRDVGPGLVVSWIGRVAGVVLVLPFIPLAPRRTVRTNGFATDLHRDLVTVVIVVLFVCVGAPLIEELFFRGLVQSVFTRRFGARVAVFAQAGCFAVVHYQVGMSAYEMLITFVTIAAVGVLLGVVRWHYQRLGPGMVAHAAFNTVAVILVLALT
jgi:uncharacterized protein